MPLSSVLIFSRVLVKSTVWAIESSGGLIRLCHLDSIFEFDSTYHLLQVIEPAKSSPLLLSILAQFKHAITRETAYGYYPSGPVLIERALGFYNRKTKQTRGKRNKQPSLWSKINKWQWEHLWLLGSVIRIVTRFELPGAPS